MNNSTRSPVAGSSMLERLGIESDGKLLRAMGVFLLMGAVFFSYVLTLKFEVKRTTFPPETASKVPETIYSAKLTKPQSLREPPVKRPTKHQSVEPKAGRGILDAAPTRLNVSAITSKTENVSLSPQALLGSVFNRDVERVINQVSVLTRSGSNRLGVRRGRPEAPFNDPTTLGDGVGRELALDNLWDRGTGSLRQEIRGPIGIETQMIAMSLENTERSSESILRSIKQHMSGLRYIYNRHLKSHPGFHGKITLKFTISPSGTVVELDQVATSTGVSDFDSEIRRQVLTWRFEPVQGHGNDVVTVPFTFSE